MRVIDHTGSGVFKSEDRSWRLCRRMAGEHRDAASKAKIFLEFLGDFPSGAYNGKAAQEIEWLIQEIDCIRTRANLCDHFRAIRSVVMRPSRPGSWQFRYGTHGAKLRRV